MSDMSWQDDGLCHDDPDVFTPFDKPLDARDDNYAWRVPRAMCLGDGTTRACPVLDVCDAWSMGVPDPVPYSMAGGRTPRERAALRRELGMKAPLRPIDHGAPGEGGERAHRRRGEKPCRACMDASNLAKRLKERATA